MRSSKTAFDAIVVFEVSSKEYYEAHYQRPQWPGVASGPTVGIGYDLGQTAKDTIDRDWRGRVPGTMLTTMINCSGHVGQRGRVKTAQVKREILVPWVTANAVHEECVMPRWEQDLMDVLPNTDKLSGTCFGMLLCLGFNRGLSFAKAGERYWEMRKIKEAMEKEEFKSIPDLIRSMKRLWPTVPGLQARRDKEARIFEQGLKEPAGVFKDAEKEPPAPPPAPKVTQAPKPAPVGKAGETTAVSLNVRTSPNGDILGQLPKGTGVTIHGRTGDWLSISAETGLTGYVHRSYVKLI
jgi:hypothetical protein